MRRLDPAAARGLRPDHPALTEKRTIFTSLVVDPDDAPRLLERQDPRTKLGSVVEKGTWRGFPIYGLTLEERATCPTSCHHWSTCLAPGTRVLTSDLRWIPIERLSVGQRIAAFDEEPKEDLRRKTRIATVEALGRETQPGYLIKTTRGEVRASGAHLWLVRQGRTAYGWVRTDQLRRLDKIQFLSEPWEEDKSYDGGRLRGFVEGEGHCGSFGNNGFPKARISWAQLPGKLLDEINVIARAKGFNVAVRKNVSGINGSLVHHGDVLGGWRGVIRFLGMFRPTRLIEKSEAVFSEHVLDGRGSAPAIVEAIEPLGNIEVVTIKTSTGTLFAEGFASHNCFGNSTHRARRHRHGPRLITRLRYELMMLQKKHPIGFVVRLHILGDFWSVEYVQAWEAWLDLFPALHVFGYTAHPEASEIGAEIVRIRKNGWGRFAMRTSAVEPGPTRAITIDRIPNSASIVEGTVCPQQLGLTKSCGSCALCWSPAMKDKTIAFVRHGMKRRGAVAH